MESCLSAEAGNLVGKTHVSAGCELVLGGLEKELVCKGDSLKCTGVDCGDGTVVGSAPGLILDRVDVSITPRAVERIGRKLVEEGVLTEKLTLTCITEVEV